MPFAANLIFLLAAFTQGVSGFGAALVGMPLLTLFLDVQTAVPLYMLNGLILTSFLTLQLKRHINWRSIRPLIISCLPGIYLGVSALKHLNSKILQIGMGVFILFYALYSLATKPIQRKISTLWAYAAGFLTGAISGAFCAGGPPTVIYVSLTGWSKDEIKATLSVFFLITGILAAIGHALTGLTTSLTIHYWLRSVPFTLAGVWAGSMCYNRIKRETYIKIMLWLLVVMGLMMIGTAFGVK